ncbi:MAG: nuclear transport factor 2 family protein [Sphingosinicella sp.]|nr:nuclear transport factor 2 family protein [Sphingosinicella sp.]
MKQAHYRAPLLIALCLAGEACAGPAQQRKDRAAATRPASYAEQDLMNADRAFAADARARGVAIAFAERYHPNGKLISPGVSVLTGPDAIKAALADDRSDWVWAPEEAQVSGDLGVTWGRATISYRDSKNNPVVARTRYVTVWRRDLQGQWKIWLDIGNRGPADE